MLQKLFEQIVRNGKKSKGNKNGDVNPANSKWDVCEKLDRLKEKLNGKEPDEKNLLPEESCTI